MTTKVSIDLEGVNQDGDTLSKSYKYVVVELVPLDVLYNLTPRSHDDLREAIINMQGDGYAILDITIKIQDYSK